MVDILGTSDFAAEQKDIGVLGENHVYFLPYLMGERSPHNDPKARGAFIGMTMDTKRSDMTQAMLEGVAFALRDSLEVAKSLGISVDVLAVEEGPSMGGAMLAMVACGEYSDVESACSAIVKVVETVEPDAATAERYNRRYETFRQMYPALKPVYQNI